MAKRSDYRVIGHECFASGGFASGQCLAGMVRTCQRGAAVMQVRRQPDVHIRIQWPRQPLADEGAWRYARYLADQFARQKPPGDSVIAECIPGFPGGALRSQLHGYLLPVVEILDRDRRIKPVQACLV